EPSLQLCGTRPRATRDARPRQLPTDTSHAVPTRECQSDPPSLPRDARHPTPEPPTPTTRRTLTVGSMSAEETEARARSSRAIGSWAQVAEGAPDTPGVVPCIGC